ncbi:hypothetical protein HWI79_1542 [Cryptosporidium felis]|nr:hypothetical protein HWI79_1542 [Cryptosporidium felis]
MQGDYKMVNDDIDRSTHEGVRFLGTSSQKRSESDLGLEEIQKESESRIDWDAKCCCTSRMKFSDIDSQGEFTGDEQESSGTQIIDEIANTISGYRRESVLSVVSEFEKKLLTLGMNEEIDPEDSYSEKSEDEVNFRRHSEVLPKPLVISAVENRRSTAPRNLQKRMIEQLNVALNEENTEDLEQILN